MAQTERKTTLVPDLRITTSFDDNIQRPILFPQEDDNVTAFDRDTIVEGDPTDIHHGHGHARTHGSSIEQDSVLNELHSATPPISVPRIDESCDSEDIHFPHRPEDVHTSPLDHFLQNRNPSISFGSSLTPEYGRRHTLDEPLAKNSLDVKNRLSCKPQPRPSGLRNTLSQDENTKDMDWSSSPRRRQIQRGFPTGSSRYLSSPDEEFSTGSELDRFSSLTSASPVSPFSDVLRTPESKESWPYCVSSPAQAFSSLNEPNSWSGGAAAAFGGKTFRNGARRGSRRSTSSSGKSPASMFLSMWSSQEEPAPQPDDEGQMVGTEYVLGKQIAFGGFSTVKEAFKVEEDGGTKQLAVKIVRKHVAGKNETQNDQVQAEFDHEVRLWRYLNSPHVLALDAVYETDYATFCFTKLAIGGTLFDLIRQNRQGLDMGLAKKYTYQLACALRYLHEDARVVHRDIKLENCLMDPAESADGTKSSNLVLCDFGMAEWISTDNENNSPDPYDAAADRPPPKNIGPSDTSTSVAGSLEYASPELLLSTNGVNDPAVDIWAFGVVAFSVVVGSRPFQDPFTPRVRSNILSGKWNKEAVLSNNIDPQLLQDRQDALDVIQGCLELDVEKRWNIRDVLNSRWLRGYPECTDDSMADAIWRL